MFLRNFKLLAKWVVGFAIVIYLLSLLDFSKFRQAFLGADLRYLASGALMVLVIRILYASQTALAVKHHDIPLTTARALAINTISQFYSLFLPGDLSAGVVRWYKLSKPSGNRAEVLAAILFIRFVNTSLFLGFGIIAFLVENPLNSALLFCIALFLFFGLAIISIGFFSERVPSWQESIFKKCPLWIPASIVAGLRRTTFAFAEYKTMSWLKFLKVLSIPFINHVFAVVLFFLIARSLSLWVPLVALIWIRSMVYVIQLIPVTISGLGLREGALAYLLPYYGVEPSSALAFSLIIFSFTVLAGVVGGMLEGKEVLLSPLFHFIRTRSVTKRQ